MSIDLNWETLTAGPDGARYAEQVRDFIHAKFQTIPFPKFIKSVQVHSFTFGTVPPDIEIKEICDPYPEFYEEDEDDYVESDSDGEDDAAYSLKLERERRRRERRNDGSGSAPSTPSIQPPPPYSLDGGRPSGPGGIAGFRGAFSPGIPDTFPGRVGVTGVSTPLFNRAGSSSNLHYFHSALSTGFTAGSNTPTLSAFVSPPPSIIPPRTSGTAASTGSFPSPPSTADSDHGNPSSPNHNAGDPTTPPPQSSSHRNGDGEDDDDDEDDHSPHRRSSAASILPRLREPRDEDTQIISRVRYAGDVRLELTAELLLEYPVSAFAALPVRLVVTGCKFDGLACLAYIRRHAHFCFLDDERGGAVAGEESTGGPSLLKEIKVESEIGEKGKGKQVLKNVGKVERFVLEQVRRIFEEEFVFPSSWTFLV